MNWFDATNGFGFAYAFRRGNGILFRIEVMRRNGHPDLQPGAARSIPAFRGVVLLSSRNT